MHEKSHKNVGNSLETSFHWLYIDV